MNDAHDLPWTDAFLVGFQPMDETHREFVELVDGLLKCADTDFEPRLAAFAEHARRHFGDEDRWMNDSGFPPRDCHIDEHRKVLESTEQVLAMVREGNLSWARHLAAELASWFPAHADQMDSALAHWLVKRNTGGAPLVLRRNVAQPR